MTNMRNVIGSFGLAAGLFLVMTHADTAKAASPYSCKASTKADAIKCCEESLKSNPMIWHFDSSHTCKTQVACGGPVGKRNRCQILPPEGNLTTRTTSSGQKRSDLRLKYDLHRLGTTVYGLPLYSFRYTFQPGVFEGVMAQDVLKVKPEAVSVGPDGYYLVNYDLLGIKMLRLQ